MIGLWIALGVFSIFILLVFLSACKISAEADAWAQREYEKLMERRSQNADGVLPEEETHDVDKS